MTEAELLEQLNIKFDLDLESTERNKFCRWDSFSDKYLAELKCRRRHYNTQMIEYDKLDCVKSEADETGRDFLYCVSTPSGIYVFNISDLCKKNYNFNWENKKLPAKTDFGGSEWVDKKVGYINVNDSSYHA
jgi:hypothetical protein